jgi:hypothetical protein
MLVHQRVALVLLAFAVMALACGRRDTNVTEPQKAAPAAAFSSPLRLSTQNKDAAEPALAAAPDGTIYVAWVEHGTKMAADVMLKSLDQQGDSQSEPVRVNPKGGEASAWRGDPPTLAVAPDGTIYVVWTGRPSAEARATDIFLSASRDKGRTFDAPVKVNDDKSGADHGMHSLAVDSQGRVFVAWLDERNVKMEMPGENGKMEKHEMEANRDLFLASSADGGRTFSQNRLVAREACPCCKTALTVGADGRVYAAWRQVLPGNYRHIAVSSSSDAGQTFSEPVIASDDKWMIMGCPVSGPALVATADNALRVLWYSAGDAGAHGLYWSESRDGAKTFTARKALVEGEAFGTPRLITGANNNLAAVWESNQKGESKIVVARLNSNGPPAITELQGKGQLPTAAATREQLFITYITKQDEQRAVWLVRGKALA